MRSSRWRIWAAVVSIACAKLLAYAAVAFPFALGEGLCRWDCTWYLSIATQGYDAFPRLENGAERANWAFFPAYPMLVRGLDLLTGGNPKTTAVIVSTLCCIAFVLLGARYRRITRGETSPWLWVLLVSTWPLGFYFHVAYAEALFAALATATMLAMVEGRPLVAGMASGALCATRPTGIIVAAWIGFDRIWRLRTVATPSGALRLLVPAAIAPLGLLAFMAFLWFELGDPLAFQRIQAGWNRHLQNPLSVIAGALGRFAFAPNAALATYLIAWTILGLAATAWLLARRRFVEAWICGMTVMMASASGTLFSMPRFVATNPAFLLAAADLLAMIRWAPLRIAVLAVMAILQIILVRYWIYRALFLA